MKQLIYPDILKDVISILTDARALNAGRVKGICARMAQYINEAFGHDVLALECLYYSIKLYLNDITTAYYENTKAPDKLVKDSVFNLISEIEKEI